VEVEPSGRVDLRDSEEECGDTALRIVRRAMKVLQPGQVLEVRLDVAEQAFVLRAWARKTGRAILKEQKEGRETRMLVEQVADG
jgi:TusA-related sulfurtransferase